MTIYWVKYSFFMDIQATGVESPLGDPLTFLGRQLGIDPSLDLIELSDPTPSSPFDFFELTRNLIDHGFAGQPDDSPGTLFSASIVDFRDEAGKRLVLFLRISFHSPTIICKRYRYHGVFFSAPLESRTQNPPSM